MSIDEENIVYIGERFFATQIHEILYLNTDEYIGRTIRYQGMFWAFHWDETGSNHFYVTRYTYGCCGDYDSSIGFELHLNRTQPLPDGAWVEVTGVLEESDGDGLQHVRLRVISLIELEERGMEFVYA